VVAAKNPPVKRGGGLGAQRRSGASREPIGEAGQTCSMLVGEGKRAQSFAKLAKLR
jgi:hypothetical protein